MVKKAGKVHKIAQNTYKWAEINRNCINFDIEKKNGSSFSAEILMPGIFVTTFPRANYGP